jgi:hypothetical protein
MKEILIVAAQVLILAIFVALMVFYGVAFWYWRNDAKGRDLRRENSSKRVTNARTLNGTQLSL